MTAPEEIQSTWGKVVESDEVFSTRNQKWYEVIQSGRTIDGQVKVRIQGSGKFLVKLPNAPVRLRRGATGKAVDIIEIIFSGPSVPERVGRPGGLGPTMDETLKEEIE